MYTLVLHMIIILFGDRDFTRPDLPSGEQAADLSGSAAGPGSPAGVPDLTTAIASKQVLCYAFVIHFLPASESTGNDYAQCHAFLARNGYDSESSHKLNTLQTLHPKRLMSRPNF
jgi:hypothetical protein